MRILDRYFVRETVAPFVIAVLVFSFILIIPVVVTMVENLVVQGLPWSLTMSLLWTLLPPVLGLTIPMAFLISVLVALSRLTADHEVVAMMACGIGPNRMLRPVLVLAAICAAASLLIMLEAIPHASGRYRDLSLRVAADRAEGQVRARQFFEELPDTVLYVRETLPNGGWAGVFAAHTSRSDTTDIYVARRGRVVLDRADRRAEIALEDGARHTTSVVNPGTHEVARFDQTVIALDPDRVFQSLPPVADRELTIAELQERRAKIESRGLPGHNQTVEIHKKFAVPAACFVFALVGTGLGLGGRRDGKLGSFIVGMLVIFGYYVIMYTAHAAAKGAVIPAWSAMWVPTVLVGSLGGYLMWKRSGGRAAPVGLGLSARQGPGDRVRDGRAPAPRPNRTAVAGRISALRLPRPHLLDIYVARLYLRVLVMASSGLLGLFYLSAFIDRSDKWFKGQVELQQIAAFMAWSTPQFVYYILAMAVLLATLVTIAVLTKRSELVAMHACGISIYRNAAPLIVFACASGLLLLAIQEWVLPTSNRRAAFLQHVINGNPAQTFDVVSNRQWLIGSRDEIYHYDHFDPARNQLHELSIFEIDPAGRGLTAQSYASMAMPRRTTSGAETGEWITERGWRREFAAAGESVFGEFQQANVRLESPQYFVTDAPGPDRMRVGELRAYVQTLLARGYTAVEHQVALHRKVAFPFVTLIMTLLAIPFAITTGTRGAMYGVGIGVGLGVSYWVLTSLFAALGGAGVLPPVMAAWTPNLLFASAATYLVLTVRT